MTDPLRELGRSVDDANACLTIDDLARWSPDLRAMLERLKVLVEVEPVQFATCGSCAVAHGGGVSWSHVPGRRPRAFIPCPENGREEIDPEQLRRWALRPAALARAVAAALVTTSGVEERSPGRVWKLGMFRAAGQAWSGYLGVGLSRADAGSVVAPLAELRAANAVVFVPATAPPPVFWGERPPIALSLTDLLTLDDTGLSLDRLALDSVLTPAAVPLVPSGVTFPTPTGTTWSQVEMLVEDLHLVVQVGTMARRYGYADAGFENRKTGAPDRSWTLLTLLARGAGRLDKPDPTRTTVPSLKGAVNVLRTRLRRLLGLDDDPFHPSRRCQPYHARFRVRSATGPAVAVPPGTTWLDITLSLIDADTFAIEVGSESEPTRCRVADLGLPTAARAALRQLVQGRGSLRRPDTDAAAIALNAALSRLLPLDGSPFEFHDGVWTARFEIATL